MRKAVFILASLLIFFTACKQEDNQEELAGKAAELYYSYLMHGNYNAFIDGTYRSDSLRPAYREQLIENLKMFALQMQEEHKGIDRFAVNSVKIDTANHTVAAFINIVYRDSIKEQILLPMIRKEGVWYMK